METASPENDLQTGAPPSVYQRIFVSIALLVGFYAVTLGVVAALFVAPIVFYLTMVRSGSIPIFIFIIPWVPAVLLLKGVLAARPPPFVTPGRLLNREEAPELFSILDELAASARTKVPSRVYLSPFPDLGVTETGGFFGLGSKRVLIVGAPTLAFLSVQELRAGLAHELGHFLGGDTKLSGVLSYTRASFVSLLASVQRSPSQRGGFYWVQIGRILAEFIGQQLVTVYARLFFHVTRSASQKQEIAADALSASLAGRGAAIKALENVSVAMPLYQVYLESHVALAVERGAIPTNLLAGFQAFRARVAERGEERLLAEHVRTKKTDRFDTHPALGDRIRFLNARPEGPLGVDDRSAVDILHIGDVESWLSKATLFQIDPPGRVRPMPWADVAANAHEPAVKSAAHRIMTTLKPCFPNVTTVTTMFRSVRLSLEKGGLERLVAHFEPGIAQVHPAHRGGVVLVMGGQLLGILFAGALLEQGASIETSLGEACLMYRFGEEAVGAVDLASKAMREDGARAGMAQWAERLEESRLAKRASQVSA